MTLWMVLPAVGIFGLARLTFDREDPRCGSTDHHRGTSQQVTASASPHGVDGVVIPARYAQRAPRR